MITKSIPSSPAICYISPISYLDAFASPNPEGTNRHLVLAHLVDHNPNYASYYKRRSDMGEYIMMDNSSYELHEPYNPSDLLRLAKLCGADAIVLPDYPFQPASKTIDAAYKFVDPFKDAGYHTFFVPQNMPGDYEDWVMAYTWATYESGIDIIGMSILGIPNALPHVDPSYARVVMTMLLQTSGIFAYDKTHHYLGLNSGPKLEIPSLLRMNALTSIDSSGPIWSAILGHAYTTESDSLQTISKIKLPVNFDISFTKDKATLDRIQHNIKLTQDLFTNPTTEQPWFAQEC